MKILSIETSCDDTGVCVIEATGSTKNATFKLLADNSNSQIAIHREYGGVFPVLAKREHAKNLPLLLEKSLKEARLQKKEKPVDAIFVTHGPGLEMCLWEGIVFVKNLGEKWNIPIFPVDHMEGHMYSSFGKKNKNGKGKFKVPKIKTPLLSLLVSGGHTQLILSKKWMEYEIIGETLDDAIGEAYDKVARMLGLPYPGGPEISRLAEEARIEFVQERDLGKRDGAGQRKFSVENFRAESLHKFNLSLPRPMLKSKDFNFSYSGLKTAVLYLIRDMGGIEKIDIETKKRIALEFENAAIETLIYKTTKAIEKYKVKTLLVGGGVSCNIHLARELKKLTKKIKVELHMPQKNLSGDNAVMIGIAGYLEYIKNKKKTPKPETILANGNLKL